MRIHFILFIYFSFIICGQLFSQKYDTTKIQKIDKSVQDFSTKNSQTASDINHPNDKIKTFPDIYYEYKIAELSKTSPIKLDYNKDVQKYIDLYLEKRPEKVSEFLGLEDLYFPIFEEYLDKYNLPLELKYLPIVESGLNPIVQSSSGAMGLWQLLLNASKLLGLQVTSYRDERCDPYLSTDAACRYLKYLYETFNDWQLALAAYNGGPGEVRNAIIRSGGKTDFWQLQPYLSDQTKGYVPLFIAIVYLANHPQEHGIYPKQPIISYNFIDTVQINGSLEFSKLSEEINVPVETIKFLNPCYRRDVIPEAGKPQSLVLPSDKILTFLKLENQIFSRTNDTATYIDILASSGDTSGLQKSVYIVAKGDFLHKIALQYGCTIESLRAWNKLKTDNLNAGQLLNIWTKAKEDNSNPQGNNSHKQPKYFYYIVKKGDTMWSISERFKCDSVNTIKAANNISNDRDLKPGQKLKIIVSN